MNTEMNTEMDHGNEDKYENICLYYCIDFKR